MEPETYNWIVDHILVYVPHFMRSWPFIRRLYWQQEEVDKANTEGKRLEKLISLSIPGVVQVKAAGVEKNFPKKTCNPLKKNI